MPNRDPIAYKFTGRLAPDGTAAEWVHGVPSRDIHKSDLDAMTDEAREALRSSPIHEARKAGQEAEAAAEAPADAVSVTVADAEPPARGGKR